MTLQGTKAGFPDGGEEGGGTGNMEMMGKRTGMLSYRAEGALWSSKYFP